MRNQELFEGYGLPFGLGVIEGFKAANEAGPCKPMILDGASLASVIIQDHEVHWPA